MRAPLVIAVGGLLVLMFTTTGLNGHRSSSRGQVVRVQEGERIFGTSLIKVSPRSGVPSPAMALMRTAPNGRSGVHVHERADQLVLVVRGSGYVRLAEDRDGPLVNAGHYSRQTVVANERGRASIETRSA
jgi:hypothetical protein